MQASITGIHLSITGNVSGISAEEFEAITKGVEQNCLISKLSFTIADLIMLIQYLCLYLDELNEILFRI